MSPFDGSGEIRNSRGDHNEAAAHLKHAEWIDQSGEVGQEQWAGVAMLDHPDNVNHPTDWHCRNDGWAGASFNLDAPHSLLPRKILRLRYRIVLHLGDAASAHIADRYQEYAARPEIRFGEPKLRGPGDNAPRRRGRIEMPTAWSAN